MSQAPHGGQAHVDRTRGQLPALQVDPLTGDDRFVKGQARLGAIPKDELINRVSITSLRGRGTQAAKHGGFGLIQIRKSEACFK